jgi:hypothetical protein
MAGRQVGINALLNDLLPYLAVVELLACNGSVRGEDRQESKSKGDMPKMSHRFPFQRNVILYGKGLPRRYRVGHGWDG